MRFKNTLYNKRVKCLICSAPVQLLYPPEAGNGPWNLLDAICDVLSWHSQNHWLDPRQPGHFTSSMVDNGLVGTFYAGYGSTHDGDCYIAGLCDSCITKKKEEGFLIYDHNSMFDDEEDE